MFFKLSILLLVGFVLAFPPAPKPFGLKIVNVDAIFKNTNMTKGEFDQKLRDFIANGIPDSIKANATKEYDEEKAQMDIFLKAKEIGYQVTKDVKFYLNDIVNLRDSLIDDKITEAQENAKRKQKYRYLTTEAKAELKHTGLTPLFKQPTQTLKDLDNMYAHVNYYLENAVRAHKDMNITAQEEFDQLKNLYETMPEPAKKVIDERYLFELKVY